MFGRSLRYKNESKSAETFRKSRIEHALSLRKERREEASMAKRRSLINAKNMDASDEELYCLIDLEEVSVNARSPDVATKLQAITEARKLFSVDDCPEADELINSGLLAILVECLQSNNKDLQSESVKALAKITGGTTEHTRAVVSAGVIPLFMQLLSSSNMCLCGQAVLALGNIVGEDVELRDYCVQIGVVESLLRLVHPDVPLDVLEKVAWAFSKFCYSMDPPAPLSVIQQILSALAQLICHDDAGILADVVWGLFNLSRNGSGAIQMLIDTGFVSRVIPLLGHSDTRVILGSLSLIGNVASGTDEQTQFLLDNGTLQFVSSLLGHSKKKINEEAMWFLSNITSGTTGQIQALIDANLMPMVVRLMTSGDYSTQKEASMVVSNVAVNGTPEQVLCMVKCDVVKSMREVLQISSTQIIRSALDALLSILKKLPEQNGLVCQQIEGYGALDLIDHLQDHRSTKINTLASEIIEEFFSSGNGDLSMTEEDLKLNDDSGVDTVNIPKFQF